MLGLEILKNVPVLPKGMLTRLLKADNLVIVLRLPERIAPLLTSPEIREFLEWSKPALKTHKWTKRHLRTPNALGTLELSNDILRISCLTMIKSSQAEHPVTAATRVLEDGDGVSFWDFMLTSSGSHRGRYFANSRHKCAGRVS